MLFPNNNSKASLSDRSLRAEGQDCHLTKLSQQPSENLKFVLGIILKNHTVTVNMQNKIVCYSTCSIRDTYLVLTHAPMAGQLI